jgi:flagellar motor protein MotB
VIAAASRCSVSKRTKKIFRIGAIVCCVGLGLALFAMVGKWYLSGRIAEAIKQQGEQKIQIELSQDAEGQLTIFAQKLKKLTQIEKGRKDKAKALQEILTAFGQNALVEQIQLNPTEGILVFYITMPNRAAFDANTTLVNSAAFRDKYKTVALSNLQRDQEGQFAFILTIGL